MRISIDCRHIDSSGIGIYLKECLPFFLASQNSFLLIGDIEKLEKITKNSNAEIVQCTIKPFSFRDTFLFPGDILQKINQSDLYYSPYFNIPSGIKVPIYTTIHDIIFPDMPELTSRIGLAARMFFYRRCFRSSKKIFTVSKFSKSRIEYYSGSKIPVVVTHSAIQPYFLEHRKSPEKTKKQKTVLFIGNIKKHKGLDCLLDAFMLARAEGLPHRLVIVGSRDNFRTSDTSIQKKIDSLGTDAIEFTGFISDEKLLEYLASAALLVQPSLYEGFGLPPLEAMISGTRALISDIPVFREIYDGFPVTYFTAGDAIALKDKLLSLLKIKEIKEFVLSKELQSKYTFSKTAGKILKELNV